MKKIIMFISAMLMTGNLHAMWMPHPPMPQRPHHLMEQPMWIGLMQQGMGMPQTVDGHANMARTFNAMVRRGAPDMTRHERWRMQDYTAASLQAARAVNDIENANNPAAWRQNNDMLHRIAMTTF